MVDADAVAGESDPDADHPQVGARGDDVGIATTPCGMHFAPFRLIASAPSALVSEPWLRYAFDDDLFHKHGVGPGPQAEVGIQGLVEHYRFQCFTAPGEADHLVFATFEMAIASELEIGKRG